MQTTNAPAKMPTPWANSGDKNTIPATGTGLPAGQASFDVGFPAVTRTPISAGGTPPLGKDFNGILNALTQAARWAQVGGGYKYDAGFATNANVAGYPKGAVLLKADLSGFWFNTVENNTTDPDGVGSSGWQDFFAAYLSTAAAAAAYAPIHSNNSAFVNDAGYLTVASFPSSLAVNGYKLLPGGFIMQWGVYTSDMSAPGGSAPSAVTLSFPIAFPNACLNASLTTRNPANDYTADSWPELRSLSTASMIVQPGTGGTGTNVLHGFFWFAIGY